MSRGSLGRERDWRTGALSGVLRVPQLGWGPWCWGGSRLQGAASWGHGLVSPTNMWVLSKVFSLLLLQFFHHEDAIPAPCSAVPLACAAGAWWWVFGHPSLGPQGFLGRGQVWSGKGWKRAALLYPHYTSLGRPVPWFPSALLSHVTFDLVCLCTVSATLRHWCDGAFALCSKLTLCRSRLNTVCGTVSDELGSSPAL